MHLSLVQCTCEAANYKATSVRSFVIFSPFICSHCLITDRFSSNLHKHSETNSTTFFHHVVFCLVSLYKIEGFKGEKKEKGEETTIPTPEEILP